MTINREEFQATFSFLLSANWLCDKLNKVSMQDCACVISFVPHFTILWKGDVQIETALTSSSALSLKVLTWETKKGKSPCV